MVNRIILKGCVILHTPDNMNPEARQMKKRILAILTIMAIFLSLMPQAALAATYTVADGEVLNIESGVLTHADSTTETLTITDGDTISVDAGRGSDDHGQQKRDDRMRRGHGPDAGGRNDRCQRNGQRVCAQLYGHRQHADAERCIKP